MQFEQPEVAVEIGRLVGLQQQTRQLATDESTTIRARSQNRVVCAEAAPLPDAQLSAGSTERQPCVAVFDRHCGQLVGG